jgi:hypothetical protein
MSRNVAGGVPGLIDEAETSAPHPSDLRQIHLAERLAQLVPIAILATPSEIFAHLHASLAQGGIGIGIGSYPSVGSGTHALTETLDSSAMPHQCILMIAMLMPENQLHAHTLMILETNEGPSMEDQCHRHLALDRKDGVESHDIQTPTLTRKMIITAPKLELPELERVLLLLPVDDGHGLKQETAVGEMLLDPQIEVGLLPHRRIAAALLPGVAAPCPLAPSHALHGGRTPWSRLVPVLRSQLVLKLR